MTSKQMLELADADYKMLKEKGKEGEQVLHYHGFLDGCGTGFIDGKKYAIDKAKEAFDKVCGWLSTYPWYQGVVEEFKKYMEE